MTSSTGVTRTPTIPMTKRDSLALNGTGSRVSLISNVSTNHSNSNTQTSSKNCQVNANSSRPKMKEYQNSDFVNSNPDMVAGKKRTPKKVKRTDSYKQALNRQSGFDDLHGEIPSEITVKNRRDKESRAKYNTLPIKMEVVETLNAQSDAKRKKRGSDDKTDNNNFQRTSSQKSGTFPSPDTDEDQSTTQPDRKKKSAFKRMKERLIQTFRKDRHKEHKSKSRNSRTHRVRHRTVSGDRVRPNEDGGARGFQTPNSGEEVRMEIDEYNNNKGRTIFQSIRSSFRRKNRPDKYTRPTSHQESQDEFGPNRLTSDPINVPISSNPADHPIAGNIDDNDPDPVDVNDTISEIFGSLIDPSSPYFPASGPAPDRSKLRLEGLKKFRPKSFEHKTTPTAEQRRTIYSRGSRSNRSGDLSPTVEIDGLDYADAPTRTDTHFQSEPEDSSQAYHLVSEDEQQRRIDDVSRRLRAIGDKVAAEKESESATSSSEAGGRRMSEFELQILNELRSYADTKNDEMKEKGGVNIYLVPIIKQLLRAHNYPDFKNIVQRELRHTMGWEQVAWYTYLMKTTMCVVDTGKNLGSMVRHHATRYFNGNIRPFIQTRPNGWESIYEETDVDDSELD